LRTTCCSQSAIPIGGVSIFIQSHFEFTTLNLDKYCVDQDIKVCALKLDSTFLNICILVIYRSPLGNFNTFVAQLDKILHKLCTIKSNLICGDVNVNCLQESDRKSQLNTLLNSHNLFSIVHFPTRTYKNSISTIDNIFIDTTKIKTYKVIPVINGLSDYDAQITNINIDLNTQYNNRKHQYQTYFKRNINKYSMAEFQNNLSYESWEQVFDSNDVNEMFNSFLNTYLRIFYTSFPLKKVNQNTKTHWITVGIKTSCKHKRKLYSICRNSTNQYIKGYYKCYCNILSRVIKEAKKHYYDNQIKISTNKNKTMWDIINTENHIVQILNS
jgi:hypothetical protein